VVLLSIVWFCIFVVFCILIFCVFVLVLNPPVQVQSYAVLYLKVMATSIPPFVLWQCLAGVFRGLQQPIMIFYASGFATLINIILDILFVFGKD